MRRLSSAEGVTLVTGTNPWQFGACSLGQDRVTLGTDLSTAKGKHINNSTYQEVEVLSLPSCVLAKRLLLTGLVGLWCCGCIAVPIYHAKKMRSSSTDIPPRQVDLTFIKVGETSHGEVSKRLSWFDTGIGGKAFFAARWAENSWGVAWGAASFPYAGGGYNEIWKTHNVIIDFDDQFLAKGVTHFADKDIIAILSTRLKQASEPTLDLTVPIKMSIGYLRPFESNKAHLGDLILSEEELEFVGSPDGNKKGKYDYKTSRQNITHLTMSFSDPSQPQQICVVLHFKQKTRVGKQMSIRVTLAETAALIKYLEYGSGKRPSDRKQD